MSERAFPAPLRHVLLSLAATLLFVEGLRAFLALVYYRNLSSLGLNATALSALLLLAPFALAWPRLHRAPRKLLVASLGALAVSRLLVNGLWGTPWALPVAGLAAASFLLALPLLVRAAREDAGDAGPSAVAAGMVLAVAFDAGLSLAGTSWDPSLGPNGALVAGPFAILLVALALPLRRASLAAHSHGAPLLAAPPSWGAPLAGLTVGAWLFLQLAVLGSPHHLARWNTLPLQGLALGTLTGLLAGALLLLRPHRLLLHPLLLAGANALALGALVDHAYIHSPLLPVLLLLAQPALAWSLAAALVLLAASAPRSAGLAVGGGATLLLLLLFTFVFAFTFAFVPLGNVWKGAEGVILLVAGLLALVPLALLVRTARPLAVDVGRAGRALFLALLMLPLAAAAVPFANPGPDPVTPEGTTVRVLSFNIHQGFNNDGFPDPGLFVSLLRDLDADIVVLQESDTPRITSANLDIVGYVAKRLGYHVAYGPPTRDQSFGIALLSRYPLLETLTVPIPSGSDNRNLLMAQVQVAGRDDIWVLVVHMGLPVEDREAQVDEILKRAAGVGPFVIMAGDFNSCPAGRCPGPEYGDRNDTVYERILAAGFNDSWVAAGHPVDDPAGFTYEARSPYERIDYVFVSQGIGVRSLDRIRSDAALRASDHLPLLAVVDIGT